MKEPNKQQWKKKFAAVLALLMVMVMIFGTFLPFLAQGAMLSSSAQAVAVTSVSGTVSSGQTAGGASASQKKEDKPQDVGQDRFTAEFTVGFDGSYIVGKAMPIHGVIRNEGAAFDGQVQIKIYTYQGNSYNPERYILYYEDLSLEQNGTKEFSFAPEMWTIRSYITIELVDKQDNVVFSQSVPIQAMDPNTLAVGILTENSSSLDYLNGLGLAEASYVGDEYNCTVFYNGDDFPDHTAELRNFKVLIVDDFDTKTLSEEQQKALADWLQEGGILILGTGPRAQKVLGGLEELLGVFTIGSTSKEVSTDCLASFGATDASKTLALADISGEGWHITSAYNNDTLISEKTVGSGKAVIFHFALGLNPLPSLGGGTTALRQMIMQTDAEKLTIYTQNENYLYEDNQLQYMNVAGSFPVQDVARLRMMFVILVIYAMIIGPVLYLILKKRDKKEYAWGIIPILSVIFLCSLLLVGMGGYAGKGIVRLIHQIDLAEGATAGLDEITGAGAVNKKGDAKISVSEGYQITAKTDSYDSIYNSNMGTALWTECEKKISIDGTSIVNPDSSAWEKIYFSMDQSVDIGGGITMDVKLQDDQYVVHLSNESNLNFDQVFFALGDQLVQAGELAAHDTATLEWEADFVSTPGDAWDAVRNLYGGISTYSDTHPIRQAVANGTMDYHTAALRLQQLDILETALRQDWETIQWDGVQMPVYFYGFSMDPVFTGTFYANDKQVTPDELTLIHITSSVDLLSQPVYDSGYTLNPFGMDAGTDGLNYYNDGRVIRMYLDHEGEGKATLSYQIPEGLTPDHIYFMQYNYDESPMDAEIYNCETNAWEAAQEGRPLDPGIYADENGVVRLQVPLHGYNDVTVPLMRLKGGN